MSAKWSYTLADFPKLVRPLLVRPHEDDPALPTVLIYAPCCGRKTTAESVIDVRKIAGTVVRGGGYREPEDHDWLCDGCQFRLYADRTNGWTAASLLKARGAPAALVNEHVTREWAEVAELEILARPPKEVRPQEVYEHLQEQVIRVHLQASLAEAEATQ